ncbi:Cell division control protein 48 like B [Apostasia shenzhenica]|uniref:Cell division control protein 48 like B n=1 Tax=Apostasia shenzhenica TaxID=1088818 RepID=A0A2I0AS30_9ASPA|nr:Cell division control protein 48 like B [Apostasia shenzhenica]
MGSAGEKGGGWRAEEAIGGNRKALEALRELIIYPFRYDHIARKLGLKCLCLQWPRGLLLYGPPGTGKTSLVKAVVRETGAHLTIIKYYAHSAQAGESEKFLREAFSQAYSYASSGKPSVIFIDEIDVLCPQPNNRKEQESRIAYQLRTLMDRSWISSKSLPHLVLHLCLARVDAIDPTLRRLGRFDNEIELNVPTAEERKEILELYSRNLNLDNNVNLQAIAAFCNGYVGADLEALCREATWLAYRRLSTGAKSDEVLLLKMEDWENARNEVGRSITIGVTKELPKVSWDEIGGLKDLKKKLQQTFEWPIKYADAFARLGKSPTRGVILHGPPGCSKTTLAKAAANAAQASFFSLSGHSGDSGKVSVGERLLSTMLTEMDGLEQAKGVTVLGATNRPKAIDAALLRPGRFDLVLYVPPPDIEGRYEILRIHTRNMKLGGDVDLKEMAENTDLFTGADLRGLCMEAGILALREDFTGDTVYDRHFQTARDSLRPSLTRSIVDEYAKLNFRNRG